MNLLPGGAAMKLRRLLFSFGVTCGLSAILLLGVCWPARDLVALAPPATPVVTSTRPELQPEALVALGALLLVVGLGLLRQRRSRETAAAAFVRPAPRSPHSRIYRALAALVITTLLAGMLPPPGPISAAPSQEVAARPLAQTTTEDSPPSGKGQISVDGPMGVQVNTYNGNLFYQRTDLSLPCPLNLSIGVRYNSLRSSAISPLGFPGWQFVYDISYREYQIVETWFETVCWWNQGVHECGQIEHRLVRNFVAIQWGEGGEVHYEVMAGAFVTPTGHRNTLTRPAPGKYVLTTWNKYVYYFDSERHRRITRLEDPNGVALVFSYDANGLLTRITDSYGRRLDLSYALDDGAYYLSQVSDPNATPARVVQYSHDSAGFLTAITDPLGNITHYEYDGTGWTLNKPVMQT
jgi:YD repeat-containing protein